MAKAYSKAQLEQIAGQLAGAYHEAEKQILNRIQQAELTNWQRARAMQQLNLIRDHLDELGEHTSDWAQVHLPGLYKAGIDVTDTGLEKAGVATAPPEEFAALHTESIKILGEQLSMRMDEALAVVGRQVDDVFRQAGLNALQEATLLGETRRQATKRMVANLLERGVTAFVDKSDREWSLGHYSEMVARTTGREATNQGLVNRMAERGEDLVKITSHGGACPLCRPWEGAILSLSGDSSEYPALADAKAAGLFHPNCVHRPTPYIPEYQQSISSDEELEQREEQARELTDKYEGTAEKSDRAQKDIRNKLIREDAA